MANAVACIVKMPDMLIFDKPADLLVIIGQFAVGRWCIVIEHDQQLVRVIYPVAAHLAEGAFDTGSVVMAQNDIGPVKYNASDRCIQYFFNEGLFRHKFSSLICNL
jgi:hypothetical protein